MKGKRVIRWLIMMAAGLTVAAVALALIGKYWLAPNTIRDQILRQLDDAWSGTSSIDSVEFAYDAPTRIAGIRLTDKTGRPWLTIDAVDIETPDLTGGLPIQLDLAAHGVRVWLYVDNGQLDPPWHSSPSKSGQAGGKIALKSLALPNASLTVVVTDPDRRVEHTWNAITAAVTPAAAGYDLKITRQADDSSNTLSLTGTIDPAKAAADLTLALAHTVSPDEAATITAATGARDTQLTAATITADLTGKGQLTDLKSMIPRGTVKFDNCPLDKGTLRGVINLTGGIDVQSPTVTLAACHLADAAGRPWLNIDAVDIAMPDLGSGQPNQFDVTAHGVQAWVYVDNGHLDPPWHSSPSKSGQAGGKIALKSLALPNASLTVVVTDPDRRVEHTWNAITAAVTPAPTGYDLKITRQAVDPNNTLALTGTIDPATSAADLALAMTYTISPDETATILAVTGTRDTRLTTAAITADLTAKGKLTDLNSMLPQGRVSLDNCPLDKGTLRGVFDLTGPAKDGAGLAAGGELFFDNVNLWGVPFISRVFDASGFGKYDASKLADLAAVFEMQGPAVTLTTCRLVNAIGAIRAEPGGTVNLKTGQIDMHIVAVAFGRVSNLFAAIPLVNLVVHVQNALTRLHIKGHWSDPPAKLIRKDPIKDVSHTTVEFVRDTAKAGGQLTGTVLKPLKRLVNTATPRKQTRPD